MGLERDRCTLDVLFIADHIKIHIQCSKLHKDGYTCI